MVSKSCDHCHFLEHRERMRKTSCAYTSTLCMPCGPLTCFLFQGGSICGLVCHFHPNFSYLYVNCNTSPTSMERLSSWEDSSRAQRNWGAGHCNDQQKQRYGPIAGQSKGIGHCQDTSWLTPQGGVLWWSDLSPIWVPCFSKVYYSNMNGILSIVSKNININQL